MVCPMVALGYDAVVLLHGFACLPRMWAPLLAAWPQNGLPTLCPLLPGHGPGAQRRDAGDFMALAAQQADAVGVARYLLVGYSMGGRLALAMALSQPRRCAGLVLISAGLGLAEEEARAARRGWDAQQAGAIERRGLPRFMDEWEKLPLFRTQRRLSQEARDDLRRQRLGHDAVALAWAMRHLGLGNMPNLGARLDELSMPVTLVTGSQDVRYSAMAQAARRTCPGLRHIVLQGVGHNVVLEAPRRLAAQLRGCGLT